MAGGISSDYVLCSLPNGTSWNYKDKSVDPKTQSKEAVAAAKLKTGSNKSPMVYIKEHVAKFFEIPTVTPEEMQKAMVRTKSLTYNGETHESTSLATNMGATGKSRSVRVVFKKAETINGKKVLSVNIPMPSSYTFGNMVKLLLSRPNVAAKIAQIVSPSGKALRLASRTKQRQPNVRARN